MPAVRKGAATTSATTLAIDFIPLELQKLRFLPVLKHKFCRKETAGEKNARERECPVN
jgi:hypothetical protein